MKDERLQRLEDIASGGESASIYAKTKVEIGNYNDIKWLISRAENRNRSS